MSTGKRVLQANAGNTVSIMKSSHSSKTTPKISRRGFS